MGPHAVYSVTVIYNFHNTFVFNFIVKTVQHEVLQFVINPDLELSF